MKTRNLLLACLTSMLLAPAAARAGYRLSYGLYVNQTWRYMSADLPTVRASAGNAYVGCEVSDSYGYCFGADTNFNSVTCFTTNPNFIRAMTALNGDSELQINWDDQGNCISVYVTNSSYLAPKAP